MSALVSCLYRGEVGHRRTAPVTHELRYRVLNIFADVDELPQLARAFTLFSYNRINLFSIADRDHGKGDGTSIRDHAWGVVRRLKTAAPVARIFMFCYPRLLGFVFNPLTVYYCYDRADTLQATLYEVHNTFGERHTYAFAQDGSSQQSCAKAFYVSPFNDVSGRYDFRAPAPGETLKLAISLMHGDTRCLSAWFSGARVDLSNGALLREFLSFPIQPMKVYGGIHLEAARLWLKGLRPRPRPLPPSPPLSIHETPGNPP